MLNDALNEDGITYWERANFVYGSNLNNMISPGKINKDTIKQNPIPIAVIVPSEASPL